MATPHEYAVFSVQAYINPADGYTLPSGWSVLATSGSGVSLSGYFGVAFQKGDEIVIAHRGTEFLTSPADIVADLALALDDVPDQYEDAQTFIQAVQALADGNDVISQSGHSLGGLLAQLASAEYGHHATRPFAENATL